MGNITLIKNASMAILISASLIGCASGPKPTDTEYGITTAFALTALNECRVFLDTDGYSKSNLTTAGYTPSRWENDSYLAFFDPKIQKGMFKVPSSYAVSFGHRLFDREHKTCRISSNVSTVTTALSMMKSFTAAGYEVKLYGRGRYTISKDGKTISATLVYNVKTGSHSLELS